MRRSGPPQRRTPLRADPERAADWQRRSRQTAAENAASRPRKPLSRASGLSAGSDARRGGSEPRERPCEAEGCTATVVVDRPGRRFCSPACSSASQRTSRRVICDRPGCEQTFVVKPSHAKRRRFCSTACANAMKAVELPAQRAGEMNPNYRHGGRAGIRRRADESGFVDDAPGPRCRHPACPGRGSVDQHHVVYRQHVVREGGDPFDGRDALRLCKSCHTSHHRRGSRVVPLTALRDANYAYAAEVLGGAAAYEYLRRRYGGADPRLDALLAMPAAPHPA